MNVSSLLPHSLPQRIFSECFNLGFHYNPSPQFVPRLSLGVWSTGIF
jgi:hypothetical protein